MNQITALKDIMNKSRIIGTGSYLPERVLTNNDLTKLVDTSDKWIIERTGIRQRHIAAENETTADIAYQSSLRALKSADTSVKDIDLIVLATTTPDNTFPSTASKIQKNIGCKAISFDVQAVCAGFI